MLRTHMVLFLTIICLMMVVQSTHAKCMRSFRVAVIHNEPLYFLSDSNVAKGSILDMIDELKKRTGCGFEVLEMSRPSSVERIRNSTVDITMLSIKTPTMDSVGQFIEMFRSYRAVIVAPDLLAHGYDLKKALNDKTVMFGNFIGTQGYLKTEEITRLREQNRMREFPDYAAVFLALKRKQIKVFVGSVSISDYFLQKYKMTDFGFLIDRDQMNGVGSYYAKSRLSTSDVQLLRTTFEGMLRDGTIARIYSKYSTELAVKNAILPIN